MKIEIWSDFACPFCYIGKKRFEQALEKFPYKDTVEVVFKAYQLSPELKKENPLDAYSYFAKSRNMTVAEAKSKFDMATAMAKTVGLDFHYELVKMTNTFDAHRLSKWANTLNKEYALTDRLMRAYFIEGKNLADYDTLVELAVELGLDGNKAREVLENNLYKTDVERQISEARTIGVQGVPFFVLNRKYGVSGAQDERYFLDVLNKLYQEENPIQPLSVDSDSACQDDNCDYVAK